MIFSALPSGFCVFSQIGIHMRCFPGKPGTEPPGYGNGWREPSLTGTASKPSIVGVFVRGSQK
jgi:hypothetical protein